MIQDIVVHPDASSWSSLATVGSAGSLADETVDVWRQRTLQELFGLVPTTVIATGHQAGFEHPGIIAKYDALHAAVHAMPGARAVELVVDQDANDPLVLSVPIITENGRVESATVRLGGVPGDTRVVGRRDVELNLSVPDLPWLDPSFGSRLEDAVDALRTAASGASSLADQVARADEVLRGRCVECEHPLRIGVSSLVTTSLWNAILKVIAHDPDRLRQTYNNAVSRFPDSGVPYLDPGELPIWVIDDSGSRRRATDTDLTSHPRENLWPRAVLMTGLMRTAVADLFIHGLGGASYDRITEAWFDAWLGITLAPRVTVTATMTLRTNDSPITTEADVERAMSKARWLHYNLDRALNDPALQATKAQHLKAIENSPRGSAKRRAAFESMRAWQVDLVTAHPSVVAEAQAQLASVQRELSRTEALRSRAWPALLFPPDAVRDLSDAIHRTFVASGQTSPCGT